MTITRTDGGFRASTDLEDSDQALARISQAVARAKAGDSDAVRFLYTTYSGNVYGYVRSILRDDHDAEDVTQHVFAKLITAIGKYDDRGVPFFVWLLRMARNAAIDHLRSQQKVTPVDTVFDLTTPQIQNFDGPILVRDALRALPEDQREVMVLRHMLGLTPGEIAQRLGKTEASIHGLQHRGRRAMQATLTVAGATPATARHVPSFA